MANEQYSFDEGCHELAVEFLEADGYAASMTDAEFEKASSELAQQIQNVIESFISTLEDENDASPESGEVETDSEGEDEEGEEDEDTEGGAGSPRGD